MEVKTGKKSFSQSVNATQRPWLAKLNHTASFGEEKRPYVYDLVSYLTPLLSPGNDMPPRGFLILTSSILMCRCLNKTGVNKVALLLILS